MVSTSFSHCDKPQRFVPWSCSPCHSLLHLSNNLFSDTYFSRSKITYLVCSYRAALLPSSFTGKLICSDPTGRTYPKYATQHSPRPSQSILQDVFLEHQDYFIASHYACATWAFIPRTPPCTLQSPQTGAECQEEGGIYLTWLFRL